MILVTIPVLRIVTATVYVERHADRTWSVINAEDDEGYPMHLSVEELALVKEEVMKEVK